MDFDKILFLGDSFTWGEGLELYHDSFSHMRSSQCHWNELSKVQNFDSIKFRQNNRFAGLVAKEFGKVSITNKFNGGSLSSNIRELEEISNEYELPEIIIFQFTTLERNCYHFSYNCRCKKCLEFLWKPYDTFGKILSIHSDEFDKYDISFINSVLKDMGKQYTIEYLHTQSNKFILELFYDFQKYFETIANKHLGIFLNEYVFPLEEKGHKIFFIDSWHEDTSVILHKNKEIRKRMIPLIYNGFESKVWPVWEDRLKLDKKMNILQDYPNTKNHHPSLESHKIISQSIIKYFKNNNVF